MIRYALALAALTPIAATAQPPGGSATTLYITNTTKVPARFDVIRHEGNSTIVSTVSLAPGQDVPLALSRAVKGDRALLAWSNNPTRPPKVYGEAYFNAADSPFPTVGYELRQDDDGHIELAPLLQGVAGPKGLPKEFKGKAIEEKPKE